MFSRQGLVAVLIISYTSTIQTANDEDTSKWVQQTFNNATEDDIDLTPTGEKINDLDCITDNSEVGTCVVYYLCDPDTHTIIADGTTLIDMRQRQCISYLDVCCGHKSILPEETLTTTQKQPNTNPHDVIKFQEELHTTPATFNATFSDDKMEKNLHSSEHFSSQCGWDVPSLFVFPKNDSAIYANYGEFPWAVALIKKKPTKTWSPNDYLGGGTLIHPSVVLTVAHKVDKINAQKIKIRAGEWDTQTVKEKHQYQEKNVKRILIHPHFFKTSLYFDVALLITESPFDLAAAPHIKPACLGTSLPSPGTECFSMGWGPDFNNEDKYATILKKIQLPLVGSGDCTEKLQQSRLGTYFRIHSSLTCAGGIKGIDTCQGDGGSALVCPIETKNNYTRYVAYGLVAYGIDCGVADRPGVYANIPAALEWINQEMIKQNYGIGTYTA
ncbi:phenoloxidase-activating factor 2-like isoform X2 [Nymphalis io]|uniref:phenoloxidase-activating factor 2-like isoform X2 n=1 Tax=Inachis io TaxID=171585 RepID=UPI002169DE5A|nr:phenoloxidase-activating factor 2-like isoform X2 [Nymphalis io]